MSSSNKTNQVSFPVPVVTRDPRFKAGRNLIQKGLAAHGAVEIFESLTEEVGTKFGESSIEAAPAYFEYGNAILRAVNRQKMEAEEEEAEQAKDPKEEAAKAAETRLQQSKDDARHQNSKPKTEEKETASAKISTAAAAAGDCISDSGENDEDDEQSDIKLALEMMENAYSIMDEENKVDKGGKYGDWIKEAIPRALLGIGDTLSTLGRHADAADAYSRALEWYQENLESFSKDMMSMEHLNAHRRICESTVLIAEELLFCPEGEDIVTNETKSLIVKASERIEYISGYYDRARDALQETLFFMAKLAASGTDIAIEKDEICHLSTMIMGVGMGLAEAQERESNGRASEPVQKKARL